MIEAEGFAQFQADLAELIAALEEFPEIAAGQVEQALEQALMVLQGEAADYPAAPPASRYRRTGTLGRLWVAGQRIVEVAGSGDLIGRVGNATPYGVLVQDPEKQLAVHKGRWRTTADIVRDNEAAIGTLLEKAGAGIVTQLAQEVAG